MRQHAFDHPAPQSGSTSQRVDITGFMVGFERHAECRECRFRQARALYVLSAIAVWVIGWYIASDGIGA
jgi:hypothetical protein